MKKFYIILVSVVLALTLGLAFSIWPLSVVLAAGNSKLNMNRSPVSTNGILDPGFGISGKVSTPVGPGNDVAQAVAVQLDGRVLVAGYAYNGANNDFAIVRYNSDGTLDPSFGGNGIVLTPVGSSEDEAFGMTVQPNGNIVLVGQSSNGIKSDIAVVRYNSNGTLDTTFDLDGKMTVSPTQGNALARSVALQPDGRIVIAGVGLNPSNFDIILIRLMPDGALDTTFDGNTGVGNGIVITQVGAGSDQAYGVAVLPNGKIVVAGYYVATVSTDTVLMRYQADGVLDTSFGTGGLAIHSFSTADTDEALSMVMQPDGKIVIAGCIRDGTPNDFLVARFESNGSRDLTFGSNGFLIVPFSSATDIALGVALQTDGKIVAVGFGNNGSNNDFAVARVNPNGSLDTSFSDDGRDLTMIGSNTDVANAVAIQPDGRIVVAGRTVAGTADFGVIRFATQTASISGRVLTPDGRGLRSTRVNIIDNQGNTRSVLTSSFGLYSFEGVSVGHVYTLTANSKRYRFAARVLTVSDSLTDVDLRGLE
ncbi:MAG: hypothetical protein ABIV48_12675 [Pyrinomonadaceae bacterium]